ncbi:hypothetical protein JOC93_002562 [Priestia taiwanensis]|nr:hypothetical protein [Priestia taiwanensis]
MIIIMTEATNMVYAFIAGTVVVYAVLTKYVLKKVTN